MVAPIQNTWFDFTPKRTPFRSKDDAEIVRPSESNPSKPGGEEGTSDTEDARSMKYTSNSDQSFRDGFDCEFQTHSDGRARKTFWNMLSQKVSGWSKREVASGFTDTT